MELVLELYECILQKHDVKTDMMYIRGGSWTRSLINDGWFIYDKEDDEFGFFTPGFNVYDRKIEDEVGSFTIEVSLTNFVYMDRISVMIQAEKNYPSESEVLKRLEKEVLLV